MNCVELLKLYQNDLNGPGPAEAAKWLEFPYLAIANHDTIVMKKPDHFIEYAQLAIQRFERQTFRNIQIDLVSAEEIGSALTLAKCRSQMLPHGSGQPTDPWTEYRLIRNTPDGYRLVGNLNIYGGFLDLSDIAVAPTTLSEIWTPDVLVDAYVDAVRIGDLASLGKLLEFPSVSVSKDRTVVTPDFDTYLSYATKLRDLSRANGMHMTRVEQKAPMAVGADLLLVPITLHLEHTERGPLAPHNQTLCLRIGPNGVTCIAVLNALNTDLERLSIRPIH